MGKLRLISRLDIKGENLIKGIHLEGLRKLGNPNKFAVEYYHDGIDELIFIDCVASLYGRNQLHSIIEIATNDIFVPITVGGGIRSIEDATKILRCGADKVAINTAAVKNPYLITDIARTFGSQCMVLNVEAKKRDSGGWEVYTNNGRDKTNLDVVDWIKKAVNMGAGEILLTSVDMEGTRKGFDLDLVEAVTSEVDIPIIVPGNSNFPGQTGKNDNNFHIEELQVSVGHILTGLLKGYVNQKGL